MDHKEHAIFQERIRALAHKVLLNDLALYVHNLHKYLQSLEPNSPPMGDGLALRLQRTRDEFEKLAFPIAGPEYSDHLAAEFQEAFGDAIKELGDTLRDGASVK